MWKERHWNLFSLFRFVEKSHCKAAASSGQGPQQRNPWASILFHPKSPTPCTTVLTSGKLESGVFSLFIGLCSLWVRSHPHPVGVPQRGTKDTSPMSFVRHKVSAHSQLLAWGSSDFPLSKAQSAAGTPSCIFLNTGRESLPGCFNQQPKVCRGRKGDEMLQRTFLPQKSK